MRGNWNLEWGGSQPQWASRGGQPPAATARAAPLPRIATCGAGATPPACRIPLVFVHLSHLNHRDRGVSVSESCFLLLVCYSQLTQYAVLLHILHTVTRYTYTNYCYCANFTKKRKRLDLPSLGFRSLPRHGVRPTSDEECSAETFTRNCGLGQPDMKSYDEERSLTLITYGIRSCSLSSSSVAEIASQDLYVNED